ncbi:MAG: Fic family protein [Synergistaceae bacterium]|nr:Fic family protein [Synergistaceae bacterium]
MASKRGWTAPFVMEAGLSVVLGDVCESVGVYAERAAGRSDDAGLARYDPYKISDLLGAHGALLGFSVPGAGAFRTTDARVTRGAQVMLTPPPPQAARRLTEELFEWLGDPGEHPMIAFAIFHYQLLCAHPFIDGNGRLARLWHSELIVKWRPALAPLSLEEAVSRGKPAYLLALERSDRQKNAAPFVLYMLGLVAEELSAKIAAAPRAASERLTAPARLSDYMERLLLVFGGRTLSSSEVMSGLHMAHRGTFRKNYLDPAIESGFVEMTQPDSPRSPTQKYRLTPLGKESAKNIE